MKYYIKTFGCQMNYSDSERIVSILEKNKLKSTSNIKETDLVIFNTCGVRQTAEDRVYGQVHNVRKDNPRVKIILTGCLANREDVQRRLKNKVDLFIEIKDFPRKLSNIKHLVLGNKRYSHNKNTYFNQCSYLSFTPKYASPSQAFVPIMTGCNNFCTYCVVPYARGREISRPAKEIVSEIINLSKKNYKEITLLGQNVNSYNGKGITKNKKHKIKFPELLNYLAKKFPEINFKFLTSHPKDFSDKLIDVIAKNNNISREIHLPFQSGSNKILKAMHRPYTKKYYLNLIKKSREKIPAAAFTTDVIVGFPGETQKDFQETVKIFKKVKYNEAYINKYSPRPGTAAFSLGDPILWEEKKRREKILRKLVNRNLNPASKIKSLNDHKNKIIIILGPTASGKSDTAIKLATRFGGEIISADSRQIYRGMDIGTGKVTGSLETILLNERKKLKNPQNKVFLSNNISHHMIDIISPRTDYNVAKFKKKAEKIIKDILKRDKLPIVCGGTGFWIKAIVDNVNFPEVKPDKILRKKLEKISADKLFKKLKKLDPARAKNIDKNNKVRLIRAIEICKTLGKVPQLKVTSSYDREKMSFLQIGIKLPKKILHARIRKNINKRFRQGMLDEVEKLHREKKLSWKKIQSFGLAYYWIPLYLQNKMSQKELAEKIYLAEKNYAKRQMTWFSAQDRSTSGRKKDKRIKWLKNYKEIEKEARKFLSNF